ncbi:hypothetical protein ACWCQN_05660 [Streptomyces sp. NPDC001984]|uniref:hypothetical protein n=1 Tax=Streptomyces sp. NPDC002619 TaxID=3364655 RepID=UPI0036AAF4EF
MNSETEQAQADTSPAEDGGTRARSRRRPALIAAAACVLALGAGLTLYGLSGDDDVPRSEHSTPTAPVTYEVTGEGTADLRFQGESEAGAAETVKGAALPWRRTVQVPLGQNPVISITLGARGGQARCALAIRGRHVNSATAGGEYGRATCSGTLPTQQPRQQNG